MPKKTTKQTKKSTEKKVLPKKDRNDVGLFPLLLILVGIIFALEAMNIVEGAMGKLWPLLLILWGAWIIWKKQ